MAASRRKGAGGGNGGRARPEAAKAGRSPAAHAAGPAEAIGRESALELLDLYNHAPCGFHSLDSNGVVVRINDTELEWLGYTREEMVGRMKFADLFTPASREVFNRLFPVFLERGHIDDVEFEVRCKDGTVMTVLVNATAVRDSGGNIVMSRSVLFDITGRRRAELKLVRQRDRLARLAAKRTSEIERKNVELADEVAERKLVEGALRTSKEFAENLIRTANAIVVALDLRGNIMIFNEAAEQITGYSRAELEGKNWFEVVVPRDQYPQVWAVFERLPKGKLARHFENPILTKDGKERYIVWQNNELMEHGRIVGSVSFGIDITDRKRAEDELEASLEEKTALLKEVHHRVKNNLQIVMSLLSLQADQVKDRRALDAIVDTCNRVRSMALLHEQLYCFGSLSRVDLTAYTRSLCSHLMHAFGSDAARIRLAIRMGGVKLGLDQAIPCGLMLNELVSNAMKHAFPGGRPGRIVVEMVAERKGQIRLAVSDNGIGFPAGFDIARSKTIGLQLVTDLTGQLGGKVEFVRARGSKCVVTFPFPATARH